MVKLNKFITYIALVPLMASCCLSKTERKALDQANLDAKEARLLAEEALFLSEDALKGADEASKKSERIFKQMQKK